MSNGAPCAPTIRLASDPTTARRSGAVSMSQSSRTGRTDRRSRNPFTSSGVYVDPPPITATFTGSPGRTRWLHSHRTAEPPVAWATGSADWSAHLDADAPTVGLPRDPLLRSVRSRSSAGATDVV